jgi:hypothetical protein
MKELESKGKKIAFPDTMSPDEIRSVIKVIENPGKYAKLLGGNEMLSASLDKLTEVTKAMEANESSTRGFCELLVKCMQQSQKQQEQLIKALAPSRTEVTLQAPEPPSVAYSFNVVRDKDGQMTSVDATPRGRVDG